MRVKLIKAYDDAFGAAYRVYTKVKRDKPEYWPWEGVLDVYFHIEKYPKKLGGGWHIKSWTDESDKYTTEKFGSEHLRCDNLKTFLGVLEQIIPDWIGKDYSGGQEKEFEYV